MYLQITTKCNMTCDHCCYSCNKNGKHADWETVVDMVSFARDWTESISIGGGEPTLHPRFFDILKMCLEDFDYVWMASNGSQTNIMYRLADIIDGNDYPGCECSEEDIDNGNCACYDKGIHQEDKLSVALSQDWFHDPINERIVDLWTSRANVHRHSHFEIRDVTRSEKGIIKSGRAIRTYTWQDEEGCICSDILIRPDGKIKLCGCTKSPIIGDIWSGIEEKWEKIIQEDEGYQDVNCFRGIGESNND